MSKYHFVREELEETDLRNTERVTSFFGGKGNSRVFERAIRYDGADRAIELANCDGSVIVIDCKRQGINKIHIGGTMEYPHAECSLSVGEGPRADLADFDVEYARGKLHELKKWRDEEYREKKRDWWQGKRWYSAPHRLRQLEISPDGLESQIENLRMYVGIFSRTNRKRKFVSSKAGEIERKSAHLAQLIGCEATRFEEELASVDKSARRVSKVIVNPDVFSLSDEIYAELVEILDFITPHIDLEDAAKYWQRVDDWSKM